jgi:hypothetical protein
VTRPEPQGIIVWGILTNKPELVVAVEKEIEKNYGTVIRQSEIVPFDYTDYYEKEMGKNIQRLWLVTEKLVYLSLLAEIKNYARHIEATYADENNNRKINIDPGILTLSNFVLATTKNYGHRIYLRDGIFAEVTLIYRNKTFQSLEWTYPDYRNSIEFFNKARELLCASR